MTIRPPDDRYEAPADRHCYKGRHDVELSDNDSFIITYKVFRGLIVHFSINQRTLIGPKSINIARIDTCRGTIHRHQYDRSGEDLLDHQLIRVIPVGGYAVVNEGYNESLDVMQNEWEDNLGRWRSDAE